MAFLKNNSYICQNDLNLLTVTEIKLLFAIIPICILFVAKFSTVVGAMAIAKVRCCETLLLESWDYILLSSDWSETILPGYPLAAKYFLDSSLIMIMTVP